MNNQAEDEFLEESENADGDLFNDALKQYATKAEDWQYCELTDFLHEWAERFNEQFRLGIETPAIQIDRIRRRALGTYRIGRNGLGLRHEVSFNTKYLTRSAADCLKTLLHELLHEWQEIHGEPGKGNYHNVEFREKARSYGLVVDQRGHSLGVERGIFTELLDRYGVDSMKLPLPQPKFIMVAAETKMKKWSCGCTNIRAAVQVEAQCLKCGALFRRA